MGMASLAVAPLTSGTESHFLDSARDALQQIAVLLRNSYSHNLGNQVFEEPLEKLDETLARLLKSEGQFRLDLSEEEVFANGVRLRMEIKHCTRTNTLSASFASATSAASRSRGLRSRASPNCSKCWRKFGLLRRGA